MKDVISAGVPTVTKGKIAGDIPAAVFSFWKGSRANNRAKVFMTDIFQVCGYGEPIAH